METCKCVSLNTRSVLSIFFTSLVLRDFVDFIFKEYFFGSFFRDILLFLFVSEKRGLFRTLFASNVLNVRRESRTVSLTSAGNPHLFLMWTIFILQLRYTDYWLREIAWVHIGFSEWKVAFQSLMQFFVLFFKSFERKKNGQHFVREYIIFRTLQAAEYSLFRGLEDWLGSWREQAKISLYVIILLLWKNLYIILMGK